MAKYKSLTDSSITLTVNKKKVTVKNVDPMMSLSTWLHTQPGLTGTKVMCEEGGCGACIVACEKIPGQMIAINSCLALLGSLDGCSITTVEGLGSSRDGFHPIQEKIAKYNASQCGYCTPGFVMNMYSLICKDKSATQKQIEGNFDGNICRCTGYRPILDAMKSFASDSVADIEDIEMVCPKSNGLGCLANDQKSLQIVKKDIVWISPASLSDLKSEMRSNPSAVIICGNTSTGIYKRTSKPQTVINISRIGELNQCNETSAAFVFGAGVCLSEMAESLCAQNSTAKCKSLAEHILKIASTPVRNVGSWAGNLMIKHAHRDFPSDMFVLLEAAGAQIKICDVTNDAIQTCTAAGLLQVDMKQKIILEVEIPKNEKNYFRSFKVMPRWQNAHAYVNAALECDTSKDGKFFGDTLRLVYGGVNPDFCRALKTEEFLKGKEIQSDKTLTGALEILLKEMTPIQCSAVDASVEYKSNLVASLFYKFYLSLCQPSTLAPGIESGVSPLARPVSSGHQTFDEDPSMFPVSQPIPKLASKCQASGEATFISDKIPSPEELHCAFVTSEVANADLDQLDYTAASKMDGFFSIITGSNLPSNIYNTNLYPGDITQPILVTDHIEYAGQPLAIVVAETREQARSIAAAVKVTYKNRQKPLITVKDAIEANSFFPISNPEIIQGDVDKALEDSKHMVTGEIHLGHQYHFYMETQIARAKATEEGGFELDCGTQVQKWIQDSLAFTFKTSVNKIEVNTKRIGGAYGGKATNSLIIATASALAAYCTRRPVCFHADLKTCMTSFGTRTPFSVYYTVGFNESGKLEAVDWKLYSNSGPTDYDGEIEEMSLMFNFADSSYFCPNRRIRNFMCKSNIPSTTWCRAPGSLQLSGFVDQMMEHVASYLDKDPIQIKRLNLYKDGDTEFSGSVLKDCNLGRVYDKLVDEKLAQRQNEIEVFNEDNKWKKRGLAVSTLRYKVDASWGKYTVLVSVCSGDGTVIVSHGGIESGQGINTKVAQVVAFELGIPVEEVMVQRTNTITTSNSECTGGSITSEIACKTALECCKILNSRINVHRPKMAEGYRWRDLIERCYREEVDLACSYMWATDKETTVYCSYGATSAEVELDVLTGEFLINRVDLIFDCGLSLNPSIDVGQVEGAFVMGLGFWLTEEYVIDKESGKLLTDGTWEYKPPTSKDIPIEWNVELLRNAPNPIGILRSKASGEPPMCMSIVVVDALKRAVEATRLDRGMKDFFQMPFPSTVEQLQLATQLHPVKDFVIS